MDINSKSCIITGSTSGIGRQTAMELAIKGLRLALPVRDINKGNQLKTEIIEKTGNENIEIMECDLASFQSIRDFAASFLEKKQELHILINNAGVWESELNKSQDEIEMTFAVNHLAPFLLTGLLIDLMRKSAPARIINISSEAHRFGRIDFEDPEGNINWGSFSSYSQSKLANILFTRKLADLLSEDQITVNCLHPGIVATKLFRKLPFISAVAPYVLTSPEKGARTIVYLASSTIPSNITGQYFSGKKLRRTSRKANNMVLADKLWDLSLKMTGLEQEFFKKQS